MTDTVTIFSLNFGIDLFLFIYCILPNIIIIHSEVFILVSSIVCSCVYHKFLLGEKRWERCSCKNYESHIGLEGSITTFAQISYPFSSTILSSFRVDGIPCFKSHKAGCSTLI